MINSLKLLIVNILHFFRYKKSYSQDGEDIALDSFYENIKNHIGFYVDIGAHHPVRFSNTYSFYKKGWSGINIDPTPGSMKYFNLLRKRDINLEIGIGERSGNFQFYCFNEPALNTFDPILANERNHGAYHIKKIIQVPIKPLGEVLQEYLKYNQHIDFFSIDVEGLDLQVLKSNDWNKFKPDYVMVEDIGFLIDKSESSEISEYLTSLGYRICAILKRTIIYKLYSI